MDTKHHFNTSTIYLPSEFCLLHGSLGCHLFRCDHVRVLRLIQRQRCRVQTGLHAAQNNQATSQTQVAQHTHGIKYQCTHHAQHMQHPTEMINIAKYRSSTHTVIYLVLFMIIFYSPYLISNIVLAVTRTSDDRFKAAFNITHTILFMNSLLNPRVLLLENEKHS